MKYRPATAGLTLWIMLTVPFMASCGEDEPATDAIDSRETTIAEPAFVVREWYPRPKHTARSIGRFETPSQGWQPLMPQPSGNAAYHRSVTSSPPVATTPWAAPPLESQQPPGSRDHWATPGQYYQQRPWGETRYSVTPGEQSQHTQPQGATDPYGSRQPGMEAWPGQPQAGVPYGVNPGVGYPGFTW